MVGGLWSAWLFWFFEALACVLGKTKCAKCVGKKFPCALGIFYFFLCRAVVWSGVEVSVGVVVLPLPLTVRGFAKWREIEDESFDLDGT